MNYSSAPDYEFIAYIDEAGDPSLKRVRPIDKVGGTEWFVLSAVLVRRENDPKALSWVSSINRQLGSVNDHVIHFKDLADEDKLTASNLVASLPIRIFAVASNKKNMRGYKNPKAEQFNRQQWFYNWMFRILAERVTDYCLRFAQDKALARKHVKFVFSKTGGHSYSQTAAYTELMKYQARGGKMILQRRTPKWEVMSWKLVEDYPTISVPVCSWPTSPPVLSIMRSTISIRDRATQPMLKLFKAEWLLMKMAERTTVSFSNPIGIGKPTFPKINVLFFATTATISKKSGRPRL